MMQFFTYQLLKCRNAQIENDVFQSFFRGKLRFFAELQEGEDGGSFEEKGGATWLKTKFVRTSWSYTLPL